MLSVEDATARVARGAAYLDQVQPGWWARIDVGLLEISSCEACVAAQLVTGRHERRFTEGLKQLGLYSDDEAAAAHGMALLTTDFPHKEISSLTALQCFVWLQDAWIAAIAERRVRAEVPVGV